MDGTMAGLLGSIATLVVAGLGAAGKSWVDGRRIDHVDAPRATTEAWAAVFDTMQNQINGLSTRIASLELVIAKRDDAIEQRDGVIRRLRAYVEVLQGLMHRHGLSVPAPNHDPESDIAVERRAPTVSVPLSIDHEPHPPKEMT